MSASSLDEDPTTQPAKPRSGEADVDIIRTRKFRQEADVDAALDRIESELLARRASHLADTQTLITAGVELSASEREVLRLREALEQADDLLRRLSEWDVLYPGPNSGDARYWQGEIASVRAALSTPQEPE
jgi:hypothetical protein